MLYGAGLYEYFCFSFKAYLQLFSHLILTWTWCTPKMQSPREKLVQIFYVRKWSERTRGRLLRVKQGLRENPSTVCSWPEGNGLNSYRGFLRSTVEWTHNFSSDLKKWIYTSPLTLGPELSHAVNFLVLPGVSKPQTGWLGSYRHLMENEGRLGQKAGYMLWSWGEVTPAGSLEL